MRRSGGHTGCCRRTCRAAQSPGSPTWARKGNLGYTNVTFAENEGSRAPGIPTTIRHGFEPDESTVSIFYAWGNNWTEGLRGTWEDKIKAMLGAQDPYLGWVLVLDPIVARSSSQWASTKKSN